MSALAGVLRLDGGPLRQADVERQIRTMRHAGPDRVRARCSGPIGLGHALLRVTHEDAFDSQPIVADGIAVVADVRLDNREELARALDIDETALERLADSALIAAAYRRWGEGCAAHLLGDFAFAVWDGRAQKLTLARDHMGNRSIRYHRGAGFFAFATEAKGLWALADVPRRIDEFQLGRRLTFDFRGPPGRTLFEGIEALPGGTVLTVSADGTVRSNRYWTPAPDPAHLGRDEAYYVEAYRRILAEAVACRIRRAVHPVGLFLSGGMDSSAIAALAGPTMRARRRKLIAVSSAMPPDRPGDPLDSRPWAEACARHMPHLDLRYVTREDSRYLDGLETAFLRTDLPSSVNRVANHAVHRALAEAGTRVVMDGHGGDYTVNETSRGWLADRLKRGRLRSFRRELLACARRRNLSVWTILRAEVIASFAPEWIARLRDRRRGHALNHEAVFPLTPAFERLVEMQGGHRQALKLVFGGKTYRTSRLAALNQQQGQEASSGRPGAAAYGLEYAQPFHDKRVIEFALAIPSSLLLRDGLDRYLGRRALADLLPPEILQRPRKGRDDRIPDLAAVVGRERPQLLAEIARMEASPRLRAIFSFAKMRDMLRPPGGRDDGLPDMRFARAVSALMQARFIEWFERDNQGADEGRAGAVGSRGALGTLAEVRAAAGAAGA